MEPSTETEELALALPQPPPAMQTRPSDTINKQTCCVSTDVRFPLLLSCHFIHLFIYLLLFPGSVVCFQPTSVLLAPCRLFQCPKTLAGLCSNHPAALNGLSLHQLSTGLRKYTRTKSCQTTVNGANIQTLISNHTAYSTFCNGLTSWLKPLLSWVMLSSFFNWTSLAYKGASQWCRCYGWGGRRGHSGSLCWEWWWGTK